MSDKAPGNTGGERVVIPFPIENDSPGVRSLRAMIEAGARAALEDRGDRILPGDLVWMESGQRAVVEACFERAGEKMVRLRRLGGPEIGGAIVPQSVVSRRLFSTPEGAARARDELARAIMDVAAGAPAAGGQLAYIGRTASGVVYLPPAAFAILADWMRALGAKVSS